MAAGTNASSAWASRLLLVLGPLLLSSAAEAQIRYVGPAGRDTNPCTTTAAPCKTLQRAIDLAPENGEVRIVGSGNIGSATIGKSLTVTGNGNTIFGGIAVNDASAVVAIRRLDLNGGGTANFGLYVAAVAAIHIEECSTENFAMHGIYVKAPGAKIYITDSISRDNAYAGFVMNHVGASDSDPGTMRLTVDNSRFERNGADGVQILGGTSTFIRSATSGNSANGINLNYGAAIISGTTAARNAGAGFLLFHSAATVDTSVAEHNNTGLLAGGNLGVAITNSTFTNNTGVGVNTRGSVVRTRGNNTIVDNGVDVNGTLTPLAGT